MSRHHHAGPLGRTRGSRFDDRGNQFPRTHATRYRMVRTAWTRKVHTGQLTCEQLVDNEGERMVRITAEYIDLDGTQVVKPVVVRDQLEEAAVIRELTERIRYRHSPNGRKLAHWRF